jgi:hypothetical protein
MSPTCRWLTLPRRFSGFSSHLRQGLSLSPSPPSTSGQLTRHGCEAVHHAIHIAVEAIDATGWRAEACTIPAVTGAGGAIEAFVLARRTPSAQGTS